MGAHETLCQFSSLSHSLSLCIQSDLELPRYPVDLELQISLPGLLLLSLLTYFYFVETGPLSFKDDPELLILFAPPK